MYSTLGIKENINHHELKALLFNGKTKECIKAIASYLGMPVEVNLSLVTPASAYSNAENRPRESRFESTYLARHDHNGRRIAGVFAEVSKLEHIPPFGSSALRGFPVSVKISENANAHPTTFISVMSHELSHVLLKCLRHPKNENEFYTDITAMLLGFSAVTKEGRKTTVVRNIGNMIENLTTTYGYLSDRQFDFVLARVNGILVEHARVKEGFSRCIAELKQCCAHSKETLLCFKKSLDSLNKSPGRAISEVDGHWIVTFHQLGYTDGLEATIREGEKVLAEATDFHGRLVHYTNHTIDLLQQYKAKTTASTADLSGKCRRLEIDLKVLERCVNGKRKGRARALARKIRSTLRIAKTQT